MPGVVYSAYPKARQAAKNPPPGIWRTEAAQPMYVKNRVISLIYKMVTAVMALAGILLISGFPGRFSLSLLKYYTIQSTLLCQAIAILSAVHTAAQIKTSGRRGAATLLPHVKGAVTLGITVTLLIYQFMLADTPFSMTNINAGNFLVHLLTPVFVIFDWVLFDEKGHYDRWDPLRWSLVPIYYLIFALVAAPVGVTYFGGSRYPYFFLDVDVLGVGGVAFYVIMIAVAFFALGYMVVALDHWLGRFKKQTSGKGRESAG
jgi:uncharacterized membrane protein